MSLEMIQDKRGPYLCISGVGKSLACLPEAEKIPGMQCSLSLSVHPQIPGTTLPLTAGVDRGPQRLCSHLTLGKRRSVFSILRAPPEVPAPILISTVLKVFPRSLLSLSPTCPNKISIKPCMHPP